MTRIPFCSLSIPSLKHRNLLVSACLMELITESQLLSTPAGVLRFIQPICTHTISIQNSPPSHAYLIVWLPREFRELAGSKAGIYQTAHDEKLAFLITVDKQ